MYQILIDIVLSIVVITITFPEDVINQLAVDQKLTSKMVHCSNLGNDDEKLQNLHSLCQNRLRDFGITVSRSRSKSLMIFPSMTYSRKKSICALTSPANAAKSWSSVFGKPLEELPPDALLVESEIIKVPQFLISILNYLRYSLIYLTLISLDRLTNTLTVTQI